MNCGASPKESKEINELASPFKYRFAFVSEGYYVGQGDTSRWKGIPSDLSAALFKEKAIDVLRIYGGPNGEYFLRSRSTYYNKGIPDGMPAAEIAMVAFGPDSACFVLLSSGRYIWTNVPTSLIDRIDTVGMSKINTVSIGTNGSWALAYKNGGWWTYNVPSELVTKLRSLDYVKNIVLSPQESTSWFVEDGNGGYHYYLPNAWHDDVNRVLKS